MFFVAKVARLSSCLQSSEAAEKGAPAGFEVAFYLRSTLKHSTPIHIYIQTIYIYTYIYIYI